jgi:hypothetical protein
MTPSPFNTSLHQFQIKIEVACQPAIHLSIHRRAKCVDKALDAPSLGLVGAVKIN